MVGHHRLQEEIDALAERADLQLRERTDDRHPHQQRREHDDEVQRVVQRPVVDRCRDHTRDVGDDDHRVEHDGSDHGLTHERDAAIQLAVADEHPQQPFRRRHQHQRRQEVAQHHVLEHVRGVQVLLTDVVNRPVARRPHHRHGADEAADVEPCDDRLSRSDRLGADHSHHVDVRTGQERNEHPDFRVPLVTPGVEDLGEHVGGSPPRGRSVEEEVERHQHHRIQHHSAREPDVEAEFEQRRVVLEMHEVADDHEELDRHQHEQQRDQE